MGENGASAPCGMVLVPAGPFLYGRQKRSMTLAAFWIDRDPVTNRAYRDFVEKTDRSRPAHWLGGNVPDALLDHPVVCVTFEDAAAYAAFAGKELPTPAQWEKAARGTDARKYPWGAGFEANRANTKESARGRTVAVGTLRDDSPYGCRGMAGNVLEWTRGPGDPAAGTRIVKGCSFRTYLGASCWFHELAPETANDALGFRCVKRVDSAVAEAQAPEVARRAAPQS